MRIVTTIATTLKDVFKLSSFRAGQEAVIDRLHREVAKTVHLPDVKQRFDAEGATPSGNTPAEFAAFFKSETEKWTDVARKSGTKLD